MSVITIILCFERNRYILSDESSLAPFSVDVASNTIIHAALIQAPSHRLRILGTSVIAIDVAITLLSHVRPAKLPSPRRRAGFSAASVQLFSTSISTACQLLPYPLT